MSGGGAGSTSSVEKDKDSQWYFSAEQLANSPSRRHGIDADQELSYRQMTAYLIQEMGQRLQVSQLCINTAIVYMHRFYAFHSFTHFHRNNIAAASLFLAAKVEEQPRKLEHVIKAANKCLSQPTPSTTDAYYIEQAQELVFNENVLLQTLGFDVAIDHPHTHVVKTCHLVKACKDLAQTSYFLASNSLHLTSMCLQYKPTVVACFCIYLACKWSRWEIPQSTEGKHWFHYVDKTVTMDLLKQLTDEFIAIYEKSPSRLKSKLNSIKALAQGASNRVINKEKKAPPEEWKMIDMMKMYHSSINTNDSGNSNNQTAQTVPYPTPTTTEQQQITNIPPALLPPPQLQQQPIRKTDMHSSQHRTHHNSTSHHAKIGFPSSDVHDHKSSHKQTNFGANVVNRPRDHSQVASNHQAIMSAANSSRSSLSSSTGRTTGGLVGQNIRQSSSQSHQVDVNYHKSREKNNIMGSFPHGVPPVHPGHKLAPKQESNRVVPKEPVPKISDQMKQGGNKIFGVPSAIGATPFGNTQIGSSSQSSIKIDINQDLSRNTGHNQRGGYGVNNGSTGVTPIGFQTQHSRQSSSSSGSNKHDPSKSISVHMQQPQHKPAVLPEAPYGVAHEPQQGIHQSHSSVGYGNVRSSDMLHSEDHSNSQLSSIHTMIQQSTTQPKTLSSMFSPDWDVKLQQAQSLTGSTHVNSNVNTAANDVFNFKMTSSTKDSPKKGERGTEVGVKKERNRSTLSGTESTPIMTSRPNTQTSQLMKVGAVKKLDSLSNLNDNTGASANMCAGGKRSLNEAAFKQEADVKIRRLDSLPYPDIKGQTDLNKLQVVNGIETNPDLVRSLLKESLCTSNALLKTEELPPPSLQPPPELFDISATESVKASNVTVGCESTLMDVCEPIGGKSEKKKKKDKHKHKEKDKEKSKDREEKKKHKKEKDRHKDKERESDNPEHVKIKISKEKLEVMGGSAESFKIKIPKDRIISDIGCSGSSVQSSNPIDASGLPSTPALKIKISKDKLENYSSGSTDVANVTPAQSVGLSSTSFYSSFITPGSVSGSSHSKKKERDKEKDHDREKDKKRNNAELLKSNGGTYTGVGGSGSMPTHVPTTSSKSQNSSKFKEIL